jgi:hypothetical protein
MTLLYLKVWRLLTCTVLVAGGDLRQAGGQHSQLIVLTRVPSVPTLETVQACAHRVKNKLYFAIFLENVPEFSWSSALILKLFAYFYKQF